MSAAKRKTLDAQLNRRVRARREASLDIEDVSDSAPSVVDNRAHQDDSDSEGMSSIADDEAHATKEDGEERETAGEDGSEESEPELATAISFGALAKAQAAVERDSKGKAGSSISKGTEDWGDNEAKERKEGRKDHRGFSRSSKHAPTEMSSKKAVSRKREVVPVVKRNVRDPRFEPLSGPVDESKVKKAYAFLDDYREDEMKELRAAIKKTKSEEEKDKLKRTLLSMESRKKAQERRKREEEVLARHKKEEKELVKQGKKPFYLKEAEKKKRVLLDQYSSLKKGQLDRVIERRRKKVEGKEKKKMPFKRREV